MRQFNSIPFPADPGERTEPEEHQLAGERGEHLRGDVAHVTVQADVFWPKKKQ